VKLFKQRELHRSVTIRPELKIPNQTVAPKWARTDCARDSEPCARVCMLALTLRKVKLGGPVHVGH
jgi:hypothetical protein